jgi:hypothetical protein
MAQIRVTGASDSSSPPIQISIIAMSVVIDARGEIAGWHVEAAHVMGHNEGYQYLNVVLQVSKHFMRLRGPTIQPSRRQQNPRCPWRRLR